ncbi:MAG: PBP1A family penicillin-binding protein [Gammaproteobacteria bacterium]|nr:PBP1A family penicillin-binding protein [Gammaproteobacteria bacterium]
MNAYSRFLLIWGALSGAVLVALAALFAGGYYYVAPSLPEAETLRDVRLQIPLSVYSRDGRLLAQFGERQRTPVAFEAIPEQLVQAILAAEDDRFFEHPGFDYQGMLRAAVNFLATAGGRGQGGSTITQQLARMYFLTRERTFVRKFKELIMATRIESEFSKQEILELYLNTYFFGQRAYGVVAAAQIYFGKELDDLTLSETAIIAGIPPGPSILNPIASQEAAARRRAYVLGRMHTLGFISEADRQVAAAEPIHGSRFGPELELVAPYIAEMVRAEVIRRFGPAAYEAGLKVTTTVDSRLQRAAASALRRAVFEYDERHGYRGPLAQVSIDAAESDGGEPIETVWNSLLGDYTDVTGFRTGLVVGIDVVPGEPAVETLVPEGISDETLVEEEPIAVQHEARVYFSDLGEVTLGLDAVAWAARYIDDNRIGTAPTSVADVLSVGDVVRFRQDEEGALRLAQLPEAQGALVSLDPTDGGIVALAGGFDFSLSNYNRALQSQRQPGSSFKPFIYSAALENGFTTATIVNDAPIVERSQELEDVWRPENYSGRFSGPTRLREALVRSLNLVSIRVVREAGVGRTVRHIRQFGFDETATPQNLALALGAGGVAPVDLARGYAAFANGGFRVDPYLVERIEDVDGNLIYAARPKIVCAVCEDLVEQEADIPAGNRAVAATHILKERSDLYPKPAQPERVISAQNAYLVGDMMRDVVRRGTGRRAYNTLGREDLAGKTGTTNDRRDAWFSGFNGDLVATAWVGFDQERPLGRYEEGGRTALPMWIYYMDEALDGVPEHSMQRPPGIVDVRINPETGLVTSDTRNSVFEKFRIDEVPERDVEQSTWQPRDLGPDRPPEDGGSRPLF